MNGTTTRRAKSLKLRGSCVAPRSKWEYLVKGSVVISKCFHTKTIPNFRKFT